MTEEGCRDDDAQIRFARWSATGCGRHISGPLGDARIHVLMLRSLEMVNESPRVRRGEIADDRKRVADLSRVLSRARSLRNSGISKEKERLLKFINILTSQSF